MATATATATAAAAGSRGARPYRWNVECSGPGWTEETSNLSTYGFEVTGTTLEMHQTDQNLGCVQRFSISGNRATYTGVDGDCQFTIDGEAYPGDRTTESDVLTLSADGASFAKAAGYRVTYLDGEVCEGNDSATFYRVR